VGSINALDRWLPQQTGVVFVGAGLQMPANKTEWLRFPKVAGVQPRILFLYEAVGHGLTAWSFLAGG